MQKRLGILNQRKFECIDKNTCQRSSLMNENIFPRIRDLYEASKQNEALAFLAYSDYISAHSPYFMILHSTNKQYIILFSIARHRQ